jgi:hypothetical protein
MRLIGDDMVSVGIVPNSSTNYAFTGFIKRFCVLGKRKTTFEWKSGKKSNSNLKDNPNNGTCVGFISESDIKVDAIVSPASSGRVFTSTELTSTVPVTIRIKNLDDVTRSGTVTVTYTLNSGTASYRILQRHICTGSHLRLHIWLYAESFYSGHLYIKCYSFCFRRYESFE